MNIQAHFNTECLNKLSAIVFSIAVANEFEANQMTNYTLKAVQNSQKALDDMTNIEQLSFEAELLETFKQKGWIE